MKKFTVMDIRRVDSIYLEDAITTERYKLDNFRIQGNRLKLYTEEDIDRLIDSRLHIILLAGTRHLVAKHVKLEKVTGTFCSYEVADLEFVDTNKRKYNRIAILTDGVLESKDNALSVCVENISLGGAKLISRHAPKYTEGKLLTVLLDETLELGCRLLNIEAKETHYILNVAFENVTPALESKLQGIIFKLEIQKRKK